jgi:hypothetical protein
MEAGEGWQVVGRGKASLKKRKKPHKNANQPQKKTAKITNKGKMPKKKRDSPQKWGYTVLRKTNKILIDEVKDLQGILGEGQVQIGKEMGRCYQRHAEGRLLVKTGDWCHKMMLEKHKEDVGPFLPTITHELLYGPYGSTLLSDEPHGQTKDQQIKSDESHEQTEDQQVEGENRTNVERRMAEILKQGRSEQGDLMGFTVIHDKDDYYTDTIRGVIASLKSKGACVLVGEEMGPSYQQPAAGWQLMILPEYEYLSLVEEFYGDVGHWLPTITPELLTGEFGDPGEKEYFRTEVDGLVSWVTDLDDQG